ncbi:MAG: hypothetical protein KAS32_13195 [Candidatus Peribacteraceae bacterium]|nr:hypothetical protein [Candidatus Peribacteraceae bacterium]
MKSIGSHVHENRSQGKNSTEWHIEFSCKVSHYPRLDTVIMVAETIKKIGPCTKTELSRKLEKKVMWPTLTLILDYFDKMGFIIKDSKGQIVWIYNPEMVRKYIKREDLKWKPK